MYNDLNDAYQVIEKIVDDNSGMLTLKNPSQKLTERQGDAIDYLCDEWDFSFSP